MTWSCVEIQGYWTQVFAFISKVMVLHIEPTPTAALLGLTTGHDFSKEGRVFLQTLLYYAKNMIVLRWNRPLAPTIEAWKALVNAALPFYKEAYCM
ncbi:hypothetical protein XELAEV_18018214mg [Xenopus laevis]|uniref:Uncharacterized protein n=1 Tax=Xenopus laevis TaxID=8355 RepID=A0A974HTS8_XENLA|nr:hypothetical protein XELAEV_18018214mg [Xenopus laevis]